MLTSIFEDTIEGNIAQGILQFVTRNPKLIEKIKNGCYIPALRQEVYITMDAETWLNATNTDDETFAYLCDHDPAKMFAICFHLACVSIRIGAYYDDGRALITLSENFEARIEFLSQV